MTTPAPTHCQVCARYIKAPKGLIAHHGYKRPYGEGYQTHSCSGAGWRPYEVACDALPPAIAWADTYAANQEALAAALLASPPATLTYRQQNSMGRDTLVDVARPVDFDPSNPRPDYRPGSYVSVFINRHKAHVDQARLVRADAAALRARLAAWVAPVAA